MSSVFSGLSILGWEVFSPCELDGSIVGLSNDPGVEDGSVLIADCIPCF